MSSRYWHLPDLELELHGSLRLRAIAAVLLFLAVLALWLSSLHWGLCVALSGLLVLLAWLDCDRHVGAVEGQRALRLYCYSGVWRLELEGAEAIDIAPQNGSVMLPWVVLLYCRPAQGGKPISLLLGRDAFTADGWRRLHLNLRQTLGSL